MVTYLLEPLLFLIEYFGASTASQHERILSLLLRVLQQGNKKQKTLASKV
jgi:hypothetical protein